MTPKLVYRAASKYRQWMVQTACERILSGKTSATDDAWLVTTRAKELEEWVNRFYRGVTERSCGGIVNPDVYSNIAEKMVPDMARDISNKLAMLTSTLKMAVQDKPVTPISTGEANNEIQAIVDSWPEVKYRNSILSVRINGVTLSDDKEDIDLGDFWMHLDLTSPLDNLRIESIDCVSSEGDYYHPHVRNKKLCQGDGADPSVDALRQGRLEDFFRVIEAVLRTYNELSPHEVLTQWYDPDHENQTYCEGCDEWVHIEDAVHCDLCEISSCENCADGSYQCRGCDKYVCGNCSASCSSCEHVFCDNCRVTCECCGETICEECIDTCDKCSKTMCTSCSNSCSYCGGALCDEDSVECECCKESNCTDCTDETCERCKKDICIACQDECPECGVTMCTQCREEHNCLLLEVEN